MTRPRPGDAPTAVSEAEEHAFGGTDAESPRLLRELVRRAATVTTSGWWLENDVPAVTVRAARSSARSSRTRVTSVRDPVEVTLAPGQLDLATLSHELAHALAGVGHGHDAFYRAAAVDVATVVIGPDAATVLASAFDAFGLDRASRRWSAPWRLAGDGFRVGFDVANVGTNPPLG